MTKSRHARVAPAAGSRTKLLDSLIPPVTEDCGACDPGDKEYVPCPQCDGDGVILGSLGRLKHYRCRQCGWTFSARQPTADSPAPDHEPPAAR